MRFLYALFLLPALSFNTHAQTRWKVTSSSVLFKIKSAGLTVDGTFSDFKSEFLFSSTRLGVSKISGTVGVNTISTGIKKRDNHLKQEEYFDKAKYPLIQITSKYIVKADNRYRGYFILTIKGITKEVMIPFTFTENGDNASAKGSFKINRRDFGIGEKSMIMADELTVFIELSLKSTG